MVNNLPQVSNNNKRIFLYFVICLFFAFFYMVFFRIPQQREAEKLKIEKAKQVENLLKNSKSAFFIPPKSLYKEVEIKGKIQVLKDSDKFETLDKKATHAILDDKSNIMYFAYAQDDKLYQQEGFEVTVGAKTDFGAKPYSKSLVEVTYISIK